MDALTVPELTKIAHQVGVLDRSKKREKKSRLLALLDEHRAKLGYENFGLSHLALVLKKLKLPTPVDTSKEKMLRILERFETSDAEQHQSPSLRAVDLAERRAAAPGMTVSVHRRNTPSDEGTHEWAVVHAAVRKAAEAHMCSPSANIKDKGGINTEHAVEAVEEATFLVVARDEEKNEVKGFALLQEDFRCLSSIDGTRGGPCTTDSTHNSVYVDAICAENNDVMQLVMAKVVLEALRMHKEFVVLSALPEVITWYRRYFGFRVSFTCHESVRTSLFLEEIVTKQKRYTKQQVLSDKRFRAFLDHLRDADLTKNKDCETVKECSVDGYLMILCLRSHETLVSRPGIMGEG